MKIEKNYKYYFGLALFIYSFLPFVISFILPIFPISAATIASIAAGLLISGELAFIASVALLGKPLVEWLKRKIKKFFFKKKKPSKVIISKPRHYLGITLLILSALPYYITEVALILGYTDTHRPMLLIIIMILGDIALVSSLLILGSEFWSRFKHLFEWPGKEINQVDPFQSISP